MWKNNNKKNKCIEYWAIGLYPQEAALHINHIKKVFIICLLITGNCGVLKSLNLLEVYHFICVSMPCEIGNVSFPYVHVLFVFITCFIPKFGCWNKMHPLVSLFVSKPHQIKSSIWLWIWHIEYMMRIGLRSIKGSSIHKISHLPLH